MLVETGPGCTWVTRREHARHVDDVRVGLSTKLRKEGPRAVQDTAETHPFFQRATDQAVMKARGVQIESWGPFAEGRNDLFTHPLLGEIAQGHGTSIAQVVLRWLTQRDVS